MFPATLLPFVSSTWLLRGIGGGLLCVSILVLGAPAAEPSPSAESKADAALKAIQARVPGTSSDLPKLRKDLLAFRLNHPGTRASLRAAALLAELPSPLDRLSPANIPALEKFDWQPQELVGILGEHRGRHGSPAAAVAFSSDNSFIASGGGGLVRLWNPTTMRLLSTHGHGAPVTAVAITRDNKNVISAHAYGGVAVFEVAKGHTLKHRFSVAAATSPIYSIACHPNNKIIAVACFDNAIRLYDISGTAIKEAGQIDGHTKAVYAVAFAPDGKTLASGSEDETARIWETSSGGFKELSRIEGHSAGVRSIAYTVTGKTLATGCADGTIRLWTIPAKERAKLPRIQHQGPKGAVTSLSFSKSGSTLAATCSDNSVRLWNISSTVVRERFKLDGHEGTVYSVAYSPDMKLLVTGSEDWTVRTWDLTKNKPVERFVPWSHLSHVYSCAYSPDCETIATGSHDKVVRFWDLARTEPRTRNFLKGDNVPVYCVAYSADGKLVAAAGQSTRIRQWDALKGTTKWTLSGNAGYVYNITYSPDGKYLLSACGKEALVYDAVKGREIQRFIRHQTDIHCIAFSPDSKQVLTGSGYYLYDKMGKIVIKDGKYVYTDCKLRLWSPTTGEEMGGLPEATTPFYSTCFSADGRQFFAGNYEPVLRRFSLEGSKPVELSPIKGISLYASGALPTPDGKQVLTRYLDGKVILWDLSTGKRVREWTFAEQLGGLALSHDSRHLAVGLGTGVVYILRLGSATTRPK
jgi:WD40 repeat protein